MHIFISYKSEQRNLAYKIRNQLREWEFDTWLDKDHLQPGTYWADEIDQAIKDSFALVAIMTPHAIKSRHVTNEWDMAIMKGKPFIPLMFEQTEPHYKYIDIQYLDFTKNEPFEQLKLRLEVDDRSHSPIDPYNDYLQALYDRINKYLSAKLITSLRDKDNHPEPIRLNTTTTKDAVDSLFEKREEIDPLFAVGGIADDPSQDFTDFSKAFDYYDGRVLLLGEPGAGKTITLLNHARDAIVKRIQDTSAPLPILGIIPTWDMKKHANIVSWLQQSYGTPDNVAGLIENGKTILLLDGLDELGSNNENDPKQEFIKQIPNNNQILMTCRVEDYQTIQKKVTLRGAITLKPLASTQIEQYLHAQPELLQLLKEDEAIQQWLDTPLLLSFFASVYENLSIEERPDFASIKDAHTLQYKIFEYYVEQRYQHEFRKSDGQLEITLEEIYDELGNLAVFHSSNYKKVFTIAKEIEAEKIDTIRLLTQMNLLVADSENQFRFVHLLLADYFKIKYAQQNIHHQDWKIRFTIVHMLRDYQRKQDIQTLLDIGQIASLLEDKITPIVWLVARILMRNGTEEAIQLLIKYSNSPQLLTRAVCDLYIYKIETKIAHEKQQPYPDREAVDKFKLDNPIKIVIVNDIPAIVESHRKLLAFEPDFDVVGVAYDGNEGIDVVINLKPDVVLMDVNMPNMHGYDATKRIRELIGFDIPIIVNSIHDDIFYWTEAITYGGSDYYEIPPDMDELYTRIRVAKIAHNEMQAYLNKS